VETQKTLGSQGDTEQKDNAGGIIILDFKLCYQAIVTKQHFTGTKTNMFSDEVEDKIQK
jgi:hypothetical protein